MGTSDNAAREGASLAGSSVRDGQTPTSRRAASALCGESQAARGTMTRPAGRTNGASAPGRTTCQSSATTVSRKMISGICSRPFARPQRRTIDARLEGGNTQAPDRIDEPFVGFALLQVHVEQPRNDVGHVVRLERRADDFTDGATAASGLRSVGAAD